ncbi:hypothetical protein P692DRAFT_20880430 [Suillus brevipes Sb2]|nr:hypothetical protein P692DRAFT_20880430 [Suillus brevipes Sb2]
MLDRTSLIDSTENNNGSSESVGQPFQSRQHFVQPPPAMPSSPCQTSKKPRTRANTITAASPQTTTVQPFSKQIDAGQTPTCAENSKQHIDTSDVPSESPIPEDNTMSPLPFQLSISAPSTSSIVCS